MIYYARGPTPIWIFEEWTKYANFFQFSTNLSDMCESENKIRKIENGTKIDKFIGSMQKFWGVLVYKRTFILNANENIGQWKYCESEATVFAHISANLQKKITPKKKYYNSAMTKLLYFAIGNWYKMISYCQKRFLYFFDKFFNAFKVT